MATALSCRMFMASVPPTFCRRNASANLLGYSRKKCLSSSSSPIPFYGEPRPAGPRPSSFGAADSSFGDGTATSPLFSSGLSPLERTGVAVHSALTALSDPTRADAVAALGEGTGHIALQGMHQRMLSDPTGQRILRNRPLVDSRAIDLDSLLDKRITNRIEGTGVAHTFGHEYATFMKNHGFDPDERADIRFIADRDLAYIMLRYRQVILGCLRGCFLSCLDLFRALAHPSLVSSILFLIFILLLFALVDSS